MTQENNASYSINRKLIRTAALRAHAGQELSELEQEVAAAIPLDYEQLRGLGKEIVMLSHDEVNPGTEELMMPTGVVDPKTTASWILNSQVGHNYQTHSAIASTYDGIAPWMNERS